MGKLYVWVLGTFVVIALVLGTVVLEQSSAVPSSVEDKTVEFEYVPPIKIEPTPAPPTPTPYNGPVLDSYVGTIEGPSGKETYYNLPMGYVVELMRGLGYDEEEYPYWEREDGCKMLGDYIMCAADLSIRPKGTILESSLGTCIVCDTGEFIYQNPTQIDIAVTW